MGLWEKYGGTAAWRGTPTLEVAGDLNVVGAGVPEQRGLGALVVPPDIGGMTSIRWIIRGGLLSKPRTGSILSNFVVGYQRQGDVVVIRYEENIGPMTNRQMQLAFRGRDAGRLEAELVRFAANRQRELDEQSVEEEEAAEELREESAPLTDEEVTALTAAIGEFRVWDDPDQDGGSSSCGLSMNRMMQGDDECLETARTYYLADLLRRNRPDLEEDSDEFEDIMEYFILCPRCIRDLHRRGLLVRYRPAR